MLCCSVKGAINQCARAQPVNTWQASTYNILTTGGSCAFTHSQRAALYHCVFSESFLLGCICSFSLLKFFFKIVFPLPHPKGMLEVTLVSVFFNTLCTLSLLLPVSSYLHITNLIESSYIMAWKPLPFLGGSHWATQVLSNALHISLV